jgi:hypothetical protein
MAKRKFHYYTIVLNNNLSLGGRIRFFFNGIYGFPIKIIIMNYTCPYAVKYPSLCKILKSSFNNKKCWKKGKKTLKTFKPVVNTNKFSKIK